MSEIPIVDTHVHLWEIERFSYAWLDGFPRLQETHGLEAYDAATADAEIQSMVFVECTESFDDETARREVEWVRALADKDDRLQGIVAHASLEKGKRARSQLKWLAQWPRVKGVRRILQDEAETFCLRPNFIEGVQMLSDYDFTFDLTVRAHQLENVVGLVDQCPEVDFVLDHIGKPDIRADRREPWGNHLAALAERPHVACKISGLLTEAALDDWTVDDVRPYLEHALECFGMDRVLFGSDWPVVRLAAEYATWLGVLNECLQGYSQQEKEKLFRENAHRVYNLADV